MKILALGIVVALAAPTALAEKGNVFWDQAYTDTVEAGFHVTVGDIRFGTKKDDNASRFRLESHLGYKFNDHFTADFKYRDSDDAAPKSSEDTRYRIEGTVSKLGLPEWLLRDVRFRLDHYSKVDDPMNSERGELRLRNRVREGNFEWVFAPEWTDINHVDSAGDARWQMAFKNEFYYKVNDVQLMLSYDPRYTSRGDAGFNRVRTTVEVSQRFDNNLRLRVGIRKLDQRSNIHNGDKDWTSEFVYRVGADYNF